MNWTSYQIGHAGEQAVVNYLKSQNYTIKCWDTQAAGKTDIEAISPQENLLVQVKTCVDPGMPSDLAPEEVRAITQRAIRLGYHAYSAKVTVNSHLGLAKDIQWQRLYTAKAQPSSNY